MKRKQKRSRAAISLALTALMACSAWPAGGAVFAGEDGALGVPAHSKTLTARGNGVYDLRLDVTGAAVSSEGVKEHENIVFIMDSSSSMNNTMSGYEYVETPQGDLGTTPNQTYDPLFYLAETGQTYEAVPSGSKLDASVPVYYWDPKERQYVPYKGTRYTYQKINYGRRMDIAANAAQKLAHQLLSVNSKDDPEAVEIAYVDFSKKVNFVEGPAVSAKEFDAWIARTKKAEFSGQTNWEAALAAADAVDFKDGDATHILFFTDGLPSGHGIEEFTGNPRTGDYQESIDAANQYAKKMLDAGKTLYKVGAFGETDQLQQLAGSYFFDARDAAGLGTVFDHIVSLIQKTSTYTQVKIQDPVNSLVSSAGKDKAPGGFRYTLQDRMNGAAGQWKQAPAAEAKQGIVLWNLEKDGAGKPLQIQHGAVYALAFPVWASQKAMDLTARMQNGQLTYESLEGEYKKQLQKDKDTYRLTTNGKASVSYRETLRTVDKDGTVSTASGAPASADYINPDPMPVPTAKTSLAVRWETAGAASPDTVLKKEDGSASELQIPLTITEDGEPFMETTLGWDDKTKAYRWEEELYLAPGLLVSDASLGGKPVKEGDKTWYQLEPGHVYGVAARKGNEEKDPFTLADAVCHPMLVDGKLQDVTLDADGNITGRKDLSGISVRAAAKDSNPKGNEEEKPNPPQLEKGDHFAYMIGYPSAGGRKEIRPEGHITRGEVVTILLRLLTEDSRTAYWSTDNPFADVQKGDWFNGAVSTLSKAGIVSGYTDGEFKPDQAITRAEFTAFAAKFIDHAVQKEQADFGDIESAEWYAEAVQRAAAAGYVKGYTDGSFKPESAITRAEAMSIFNRMLGREAVDEDSMAAVREDMQTWTDNADPAVWYYAAVQEATNSHRFHWEQKQGQELRNRRETWEAITPARDWTALERN